MTELKTRVNDADVSDFLNSLEDLHQRKDCLTLVEFMAAACQAPARMWGNAIVGFGQVQLTYTSGRKIEWMRMGFSPRKGKLSLYLPGDLDGYAHLLMRLGPHATGKGCLYVKRLNDVDLAVLKLILDQAVSHPLV